ncbi:unnamed protein product [Sphenostylis stenocarpa]|uniref:Uncharacterized protein n=1 Tax=Sphenostylis stenocarpa TaxID=92480 RepID=A0AA86T4P2_9FABA|nr:unnamed protein product [Sphenostylis stenocarpa]
MDAFAMKFKTIMQISTVKKPLYGEKYGNARNGCTYKCGCGRERKTVIAAKPKVENIQHE